jgi:hypothetical protein
VLVGKVVRPYFEYRAGTIALIDVLELEPELIQTQMAQKPVLRGEVGATEKGWPFHWEGRKIPGLDPVFLKHFT